MSASILRFGRNDRPADRAYAFAFMAIAFAQAGQRDAARDFARQSLAAAGDRPKARGEAAMALAAAGDLDQAIAIADPGERSEDRYLIARALAGSGHLREALALAERSRDLSAVASTLADFGHVESVAVVETIWWSPLHRAHLHSVVATNLARAGNLQAAQWSARLALAAAERVATSERYAILGQVAGAAAHAGLLAEVRQAAGLALEAAEAADGSDANRRALPRLAGMLAEVAHWLALSLEWPLESVPPRLRMPVGPAAATQAVMAAELARQALAAAIKITDDRRREDIGSLVAPALARAGHAPEAVAAAESIADPGRRREVLGAVAWALAASGHLADAAAVLEKIGGDPKEADDVLASAAQGLAQQGRAAEAIATATRIADPRRRDRALATAAEELAEAGNPQEASLLAERVQGRCLYALAIARVAEGLAASGRGEDAKEMAARALDSAVSVSDPDSRARLFNRIARTYARLRKFRDAREAADHCPTDGCRLAGYTAIMNAYASPDSTTHPRRKPIWLDLSGGRGSFW